MLKHVSPFVLTAALAAALIACSNSKKTETASTGAPSTPAASTTPGAPTGAAAADPNAAKKEDLNVDLKMDPAEPAPHKTTSFQVKLTDASGAPLTGADVMASIEMTGMDMGKNEVKFKDTGGGNYKGDGKFSMAGNWNIVVTAKKGDKAAKKTFPAKSVMEKP